MNKKLLVVCLAAGAFLLPSIAGAGVVSGLCVDCHTMHNSQGNTAVNASGPQDALLTGTGCVGCHATGGFNTGTNGMGDAVPNAPQVDDSTNTNNGGYFDVAAADANKHNVADFLSENADVVLTTIPGGTGTTANGTAPVIGCSSCHTRPGHHTAATGYRMLLGNHALAVPGADYGNRQDATVGIGNRGATVYDSADMNLVCAACHTDFHEATTPGSTSANPATYVWVRHPTDVDLSDALGSGSADSIVTPASSGEVPLGTAAGGADQVMCISCHNAHGSDFADLLSYDYTLSAAGGSATVGCESCHSYLGSGM